MGPGRCGGEVGGGFLGEIMYATLITVKFTFASRTNTTMPSSICLITCGIRPKDNLGFT